MEGIFCGGNYIYENGRCVVMNIIPTEIKYKEFEKIQEINYLNENISYLINSDNLFVIFIICVIIICLFIVNDLFKENAIEDEFSILKKELKYILNKQIHSYLLKTEVNQLILSLEKTWNSNKELDENVSDIEIKEKLKIENKNILLKMKNIISNTIKIEESEDEKRIVSILSSL